MSRRGFRELCRFGTVGASGYVVNLAAFAVATAAGTHHLGAATLAFLVAVTNNFFWNRRWTFRASDGAAVGQAARFFVVSTAVFLVSAALLDAFVSAGLPALPAQAVAIVAVTPLSFAANKLWCFRDARRRERAPRADGALSYVRSQ
ncbi:MAG TPA: GtrA family protein [Thermoleophilaceae bacterium]